jgi:orotate phosphoribosyltransferase
MKISVPTFKKNNLPETLKNIPITVPGSRFIK